MAWMVVVAAVRMCLMRKKAMPILTMNQSKKGGRERERERVCVCVFGLVCVCVFVKLVVMVVERAMI